MAYDEDLALRIRKRLSGLPEVEEKTMMGGLAFMVNGKMCIGIMKGEMMCRIAPERQEEALARKGSRIMDFTGRPMKGYVLVSDEGIASDDGFEYWVQLCLQFNPRAKSSKKR
jgi:hypothetical protein